MDRRAQFSAWDVVNTYPEEQLAKILWEYGEERLSRRIARSVVRARPVDTTGSLASIVERCVGGRFLTKSLARVFQALRIEVNSELGSLREVLAAVPDVLQPGGRCVVISYHSLEDRIVKDFFRAEAAERAPSVKVAPGPWRFHSMAIRLAGALTKECMNSSGEASRAPLVCTREVLAYMESRQP